MMKIYIHNDKKNFICNKKWFSMFISIISDQLCYIKIISQAESCDKWHAEFFLNVIWLVTWIFSVGWYNFIAESYREIVTNKFFPLFQGFIIAFTSNFIPRLVYLITVSKNYTLDGFLENSLSEFRVSDWPPEMRPNVSEPVEICRYTDYRNSPTSENKYEHSSMYWHVLAARLAFVVVFEVCMYAWHLIADHFAPFIFFFLISKVNCLIEKSTMDNRYFFCSDLVYLVF